MMNSAELLLVNVTIISTYNSLGHGRRRDFSG